jgi:mucin-19
MTTGLERPKILPSQALQPIRAQADLTLSYLSSGQVIVNGAINSTSTGRINVLAQSFYASNTSTSGTGANISIANNITTKGGFIALDGTGGSISSTGVITKGPINNGTVTLLGSGVVFNTTTTGVTTVTAATTGGNLAVTTSQTLAPNFGPYGAWYIGGYVDINSTSSGTAQWGFVFNSYLTTFPIAAVGDINITVNNTSSSITSGRGVIDITSSLRSFAGAVNLSATTTGSAIAVNSSAAITAANGINIIGTSGTAATVVSLSSSIITNAAGNITITGNNSAAGGNTGISSSGAITQNANGGNITFTSNNIINQAGAITLAANTSANAANIIYNTTAGSSGSNVTTGVLTIASGSTSPINYTIQTAGSAINPGTIGTTASPLPGFILLDNTFGCTTAPCTRVSGFINTTTGNHTSLASASTGITINTAVVATGNITMNGVTSTSNHGIYYPAAITSTNGSAVLNGGTASGIGVYAAAALTANNITITATKSTAGGNAPAYLDILRINSGAVGGSITVTGNVTASPNLGTANGIYQAGAITGASGSNISFISNNSISQNGAITLAANTSVNAANIIYNTTTGTKGSSVVAGALTIASGSTAAINYTIQTAGASINPGTIGTVGVSLPGFILLDNTFGGTGGANGAPLSGFINTTTGNLAALATASTGITINGAVFTTGNVSLTGVTNATNRGIEYSATITSSNGSVLLNGGTVSGIGVYGTVGIVANNITITGTATTTGVNYASYIEALRVNIAGGNISIIGNVISNPGTFGGIYQSGAITLLSGSNLSLVSNNDINQLGAIGIAANISSSAVNITYNTTTGNKGSSVVAGALTIASGSTAAINYSIQTAGGSINPGTIGTVSVALPGSFLLDNTFGGTGGANGAPLSGFINTTTGNLAALATASTGITINNALFATGNITMNGVTNGGNDGIIYTAGIASTNGAVVLNGGTVSGLGVFTNNSALIRGNTITITGTSTQAPNWAVYISALTINSGSVGGSISVTGNVINLPGATGGIYQSGAITLANGSNLSFISNNNIDQNGLITIPANLSGTAANITYNTTSGDRTSSIGTGALSITAGSTASINYSVLSSGSSITVGGAVVVPGTITLDNTYGCAASTPACTPATGYINNNLANWTTLAVASTGISVSTAATMSGTAVTINAVNSNVNAAFQFFNSITATTGDITINALGTSGWIVTNGLSGVGWYDGSLTANSGAVRINATATTTGIAVFLHGGSTMGRLSARAISVESFSISGTYAAYLAELRIAAGGTNINITGTVGATSTTGIYQTGAIVSSAAGSNISFITNGKINQLGAISLVSNTTQTAVSITYNTTSGDKDSSITTGALTVAAGTNTTPINFVAKSSGSAINPGAIGTSTINLPGYILIDNTYGCSAAPCTPITGFINTTTNNLAALATGSIGVTINAAIFASGNISLIGVTNGTNRGIEYSAVITSTNDSVNLNGGTVSGIGVYGTVGVVANNITILGTASSTAVSYAAQIEALRINSGATGGSITVTGNVIGNPGAYGGIYQSGAIFGANGSNIRFISNNNISQNGAITLVANTSGIAANVLYDLTTGLKTSSILTTGTLAIPAGSSSAINYTIQTAGAAINPGTIGTSLLPLPGFVLLDNTYGCATSGCTPLSGFINTTTGNHTSLASSSTGITINTAVVATGNITMNGVTSTSNHGIYYPAAITSTNGVVVLNGGTATGIGVYGTAALTANNITIMGTKSTAGGNAPSYIDILRINSGAVDGNISVTGNVTASPNLGTANGIYQSGAITGISGSNISFISNNNINQVGAIGLAANISGRTANITYNTTAGSSGSNVTTGVLTIASGSTSPINYTIQTAGSAINPGTIGTSGSPLPGVILLDNTFGCTASTPACTPVTGFINTTTGNHTTLATASNGILINTAIVASGNITMNGVTSTTNHGIYYPAAITSTAGSVVLNGGTASGIGVYGGVALTANNITITGTATTTAVNYASYLDILQINSGFVGGNITVTGNVIGRPGANGGIYQAGAITLTSGSNLSFTSNNDISQNGAISVAANGSGTAANIIYNTTSGNNTSLITTGTVTVGAGTNNAAINYQVRTNGATISVPAITVPGFILLDNSCLGCNTPVTTSTAASNGAAITITGALSAGSLAGSTGVTINAVANGTGIGFTQGANAISSTAGGITITVNGQTGTGYSSSGNLTATGQAITVSTTTANITTTSAGAGISTSGLISGGAVTLLATQSATATLVPITATGTITANSLTVTGTGGVSTTVVSLGAITINAGGGNITITGNNAAAGSNIGITQTGAITNNAVGSNISFISNNDITQGGAIGLVANTGTSAANIIYNTTSGNNTSLITTGTVTVGAGTNNAAINYQVRTNGATISVPAITVPGFILLDNSCLGCNTPVTTSTAASNGAAITITGALSAGSLAGSTGVTINAVANGTGIGFTQGANAISSTAGGITITVNGQTGTGYSSSGNLTATGQAITVSTTTANITTTSAGAGISTSGLISGGAVTLLATQSATATLVPITATGTITANSLTVTGTGGVSTTVVSLGAITINAGGGNITITGNNAAAGSNIGITQTGAITNNAVGSNISFISNNDITQGGAIGLVANTGTSAANIIYNTTSGNNTSLITTGTVTVGAGTNNAAINYQVRTNGATISVPAITVPGFILLDNSCLGCNTPVTTSTAASNGAAITITGALSAGSLAGSTGVTINAVANGTGIGFTQGANAISSTAGGITITVNGQTGTGYSSSGNLTATGQAITVSTRTTSGGNGINNSGAISGGAVMLTSNKVSATNTLAHIVSSGLITANSLTVNSSGGLSTVLVSLGAITINAGGGNISVTAVSDTAGGDTGIYQIGDIRNNAAGSNISFISNNIVNQVGTISLVANTGSPAANVIYDTTSGTRASNISGGVVTVTSGVGSVINYIARSAGSAIWTRAIGTSSDRLPGTVNLDNTFGCSPAACTRVSGFVTNVNASTLATASSGVTVSAAIHSTGNIAITGVSSSAAGVDYAAAINSSAGSIYIAGTSIGAASTSYGIHGSAAAGVISALNTSNGYVSLSGIATVGGTTTSGVWSSTTTDGIRTVAGATITGGAGVNLFADGYAGNITTGALIRNSGTTSGVTVNAYGNVSLAGATNSGVDGMRIIAGRGIPAGVATNSGNVTAVGTLTNTGGVIGVSMAAPGATTGDAIATALGITSANADATKNITYGVIGGAPEKAVGYSSTYTSGNFISYRQRVAGTVSITVSLSSNYSAVYGTAFDSDAANAWIQANSTVSFTGAYTPTFGIASTTLAYARSVLVFSPTVGGSTAANGTNANAVQSATTLTAASLSASDGSTVTLSGTARTYTITPAVLGIAVSGVYNGTTTFTSANSTITTTGLASWDRITSVTVSSANANGASTFVSAIAGNTPATASNTFSASNYILATGFNNALSGGLPVNTSQATATNRVSITPAPLGVTINAVYSGSTAVTPSAFTVTGLVNNQTIAAISAATINNANVSANAINFVTAITVSSGTASMNNYSITPAFNTLAGNTQNTVTLTPKALTVTGVTIAAKTYDGTTAAVVSGGSLVGVVSGDTANVTLTQTASFVSAGAANNVALIMNGSIAGSASSNYTLTVPTGITANIARRAITVGGTSVAAHKVYDGTTATTISGGTLSGVITADLPNVSLSQSGNFVQSGVGTGLGVVVSTSITGSAAANYVVTQPANLSANITAKVLTVSGTAVTDKVYNGSTLASITGGTLVGVVSGETVTLTQAGTFASANVGTAIPVTITNSIGGAASANYTLVQPTGITGRITPAPLGISVAAIYSGSTTITPSTFTVTGLVNSETITGISSVVINNMNVAGNSTNFVRSIVISGGTANANNYAFTSAASSSFGTSLNSVTLTAKTLTVTGTLADSKVYDGTTAVKVWGGSLVGVVGVDVVTLRQAGVLNSPNVGNAIPVVMSNTISGFSAPNYSLVQPSGVTGVVTPRVITVSDGTVAHKVYDGTTNAVITGGSLVGVLSGDASNVILTQAGRFSSPNVSNGIIIITSASISGSAAGNYTLIQPAGITANITPAMLGISVVGVANGTNTITPISYTINGLIGGQTITGLSSVSVKSSSISSNGSNFVTGIVISGGTALATNYAFAPAYSASAGATQNIATLVAQNQKILSVTGAVAASKVYDGTTAITVSGGTLVGVTSGDTINLVQSGVLINPNVSATAAVALNFSITGTNAANYILVQPSGITTIVTPAPIGIVVTGEYNGTTSIVPSSFAVTGLVAGETITGLSSATFNAINVSNNGSNFVTSIVSSGGTALLSNYSITPAYRAADGTTKNIATLTPKALTVGGVSVATSKVYDGSMAAAITGGSLVGVVGSDNVILNQAGSFAQATVANGIAVTSNSTLSGLSASNYSLIQPTGITGNITQKSLTISGVTVANKVYDAGTGATVTGGTLVGLIGTDGANVTLSQSGVFASPNAANGISVAVTSSISGAASGNYTLVQPNPVSANITPKALTVTGTVVSNKEYDRTTTASVTAGTLVGVISTDNANVTLTRAGTFASSDVGTAIAIVMNNSISGSASANYTLTQPSGITANITAKALTITAGNVSSIYGSTTSLGTSAFTQSGLITGDTIAAATLLYSGSSAVASTVDAGTYNNSIIASAATGTGLTNYAITYVAGNLTVTPATLTVTPISRSVVYNGNALNASTYSANAANYAVLGYKNADSASNTTLAFTGSLGFTAGGSAATVQNAGVYGYTANTLAITTNNTNYQVVLASSLTNSYAITPATVSLSASKVFDGTATFTAGDAGTSFTVTTGIGSQTLTVNGSASANSANVIGVSSLNTTGLLLANGSNGGLASNYVLPATTANVAITPKAITVSIANQTKVYDTTTAASLTAGTSSADGSYILSGFMGNDGAYITQAVGSYNSANVANATTVSAVVGASYVAKGGAILTNYVLPTTASTTVGGASITPAPLTMTANDVTTYIGVAPATPLAYQLSGLLGADTASTAISNPNVTYSAALLNASMNEPTADALTPVATSLNYSLTFVKGSLMVAGNRQMVLNAGSNTAIYGLVNSDNVAYLGDALATSSRVSAGYCTNCGPGVTTPNIIDLVITAPTPGSNVWTATDNLGSGPNTTQGKYTFAISPSVPAGSYRAGSGVANLNVGNYSLNVTPGSLATVANYTTNYDVDKPIIYNAGTLSITPKALIVSGSSAAHKVYDATNVATITGGTLVGLAANDSAHIGLTQSGSFASVNVADGIAVTASNSLTGAVASNYTLTQPTGLTANITAAPVTISGLSAANKVYNANQVAVLSGTPTISGLLGSDTAAITSGSVTGQFTSPNVGTGITVTADVGGLTISNSNYSVVGVSTPMSADITPAPITVTAAKTYDGSNTLSSGQMTVAGVAGQTLTFTAGTTGTLTNPNVGSASLAALNNPELVSGTGLASNYTVVDPILSTVTISPAAITVGVNNLTKVYDTTLSTASAAVAPILQLKSGTLFTNEGTGAQDALSGGTFAYTDANAGSSKTVNVSNASVVSGASTITQNYAITYEANTASEITRAPVLISGLSAVNKVYDTNRVAALTGTPVIASGGLLTGDTSTLSGTATAGTFTGSNVGNGIAVTPTLSGLSLSNTNYYVAGTSTALSANITAAPLTISGLSATNKVYDTTTTATLTGMPTVQGVLTGDSASVTGLVSGSFDSANKGNNRDVTVDLTQLVLSNSNYYLSGVTTGLKANITAAPVIIGGLSAIDKVYDKNADAVLTGTPVIASGLLGSDSATLAGTATAGTFASLNAGNGITVTPTLTGLSLNNANYFIAGVDAALTATITPAPVTISGLSVANKVYDATTTAAVSGTPTAFGVLSGDNATISGAVNAAFVNANAGTGIAVTANLAGLVLSNSNYQITGITTALAADITAAPLTVTADNKTMVYGSSTPTLTYSYSGLVGGDISVSFSGAIATNATSSASVGNAYTITQGTLASSGNYSIATFNAGNLIINPRPVSVTVDAGQSKVYGDADPNAFTKTIQAQGTDVGLLTGSTLGGSLTRAAGENVGAYAISSGTMASANPNYAITFVGADFAITPRPITITADSGQTKVYGNADGVLTYVISSGNLATFNGVTDALSGALIRDAGNQVDSIYAINQGGLTNTANPNYSITYVGSTFQVTPRPIVLTAPTINKVYDGSFTYDFTAADLAAMNQQLVGSDTFSAAKAVFNGNDPNVGSNKVIIIDPTSVVIRDGNAGRNYSVSTINSNGNITPASLIVTAANDAKFSVETDAPGYAGALYKGFVNGDTAASLPSGSRDLVITRSDASNNTAGTYTLTPSGHGTQGAVVGNYQISYVNGTYTILGPQDVLIRVSAVTSYASTPTYQFTAKYIASNGSTISYIGTNGSDINPINLSTNGSAAFTLNDGVTGGGRLTAAFVPLATTTSASGLINAGQYNVSSAANPSKTGFANLTVVGSLIVEPMVVAIPNLSAGSFTKVYDGSAVMGSQASNLFGGAPLLVAGDAAALSAIGTYDDKNVGVSKTVTIKFGISGNDAANYVLSTNQISGSYGTITQLNSVTYIGPVGGSWSDANNWAGGAIPDLSNVANVVIPTGTSVSYDSGVAGPVTSQVAANGSLSLANAGAAVSLGGISGSGSIALGTNNLSLTAAAGGNFSGAISGAGGLTVAGGTQTLSGANTYTGNTAINSGASLIIAGAGQLGGGNYAGSITNNGSFVYASSATQTVSGVISGSGSLTQTAVPSGAPVGTLILAAANTYTGATTVNAGILAITNAGALGTDAAGTTVNTGGTLDLRNVTGVAEPITLAGGTLATSTGTSSVTAPISISGASTVDVDGTELTLSGVISGSGSLEKEGDGTLILTAANTYSGTTSVDAGILAITNVDALGSAAAGSGTTVNTGGTLDLRNVSGVTEPITLAGGTLATSTGSSSVTSPMTVTGASTIDVDGTQLTLTNTISGAGSLDKTGAGTLLLEAANTYSGATTVNGGTLAITNAGALGSAAAGSGTTVNTGGTLDLRNVTGVAEPISLNGGTLAVSTGSSSVTSPMTITGASTIDVDGTQLTLSNVVSGSGSLDKTGTGTLLLEAANTYTGATRIDAEYSNWLRMPLFQSQKKSLLVQMLFLIHVQLLAMYLLRVWLDLARCSMAQLRLIP